MTLEDPEKFGEVFVQDGYNIFVDTSLLTARPYFQTSINWIVHNDYHSFDLGQTVFEQTNCIGFFKELQKTQSNSSSLSITPIPQTTAVFEVDLLSPQEFTIEWPEIEFQEITCGIDTYTVTCVDPLQARFKFGLENEILEQGSKLCS